MEKIKITTKTGFKFEVDERIFTDYRFVDAVAAASDSDNKVGELRATTEIVNLIFGDKKKEFMDHLKKKNDGFIPAEVVNNELQYVITQYNALKNS